MAGQADFSQYQVQLASGVPQGLILRLKLFSVFTNNVNDGTEYTLCGSVGDKLWEEADMWREGVLFKQT